MKRRISSGYGLTLIELVIVIGFFAVFAAAFAKLFFTAHTKAVHSADESRAVIAAENAAECFKSGEEPTLFYDQNWRPAKNDGAVFRLTLASSATCGIISEQITVITKKGETLYKLTVKKPEGAA